MAGYSPLKITGNETGLVKNREEFLLPNDAYPTLQNAYVWRERILRKRAYVLLGRLQRSVTRTSTYTVASFNLYTFLSITEATRTIVPGSIVITLGAETYVDNGNGTLTGTPSGSATINYISGVITFTTAQAFGSALTITLYYYPGLPVMGIRTQELQNSAIDQTIFFDQVYAYIFDSTLNHFVEFIPGTTWNASGEAVSGTSFFWSTNYWVSSNPPFTTTNQKLFWVTNNTGAKGATSDPIRITDGITWLDFVPPTYGQIDAAPNYFVNCLSFLPFRGRLVAFNTWEGTDAAQAVNYSNRIRWSTIGNPFIPFTAPSPGVPAKGSWRDDIRGQGGFLDIPTSEDIVSVGFVRDNLVIYCERSTWQLRYTGRSIAPFQIERVNSELGGEGPFSAVQFDTSLVGIGDKGIVECDSYQSQRIDIKIPDIVFGFQIKNNGPYRVHGIRDFIRRLAYWTIPVLSQYEAFPGADGTTWIFPNQRLVYNYENDSWALFNDSLTTLGNFQPVNSRTWLSTPIPWIECNFSWKDSEPAGIPSIVAGNQQGFIEYIDVDGITTNDVSLYISAILGHATSGPPITGTPTVITSPNHNMNTGFVIEITSIPASTPYANLNGGIFYIEVIDQNTFTLWVYDPITLEFSTPQLDVPAGTYIGGGLIQIRENFSIISKKFNFLDEGQNIQLGYIDILMQSTSEDSPGAISLNVYLDYDDDEPSNTLPRNKINSYASTAPDTFFNSTIPTSQSTLNNVGGSKFWQRVYCPTRANFITLEYTLSNAQMAGTEQTQDVQIDAQVLYIRKAGRMTQG